MELSSGDVAVVTGAASGIGFALADRFARSGLHVAVADVDEVALAEAAERLRPYGTEIIACHTDVSREEQVYALADATIERFGSVQVVCNNAGVAARSDPWLGPISAWKWVFGVNVWGVIHGVRAFLPHLAAGGRGHIVNTASMAGLAPGFGAPYDASKHAVVALSEDLFLNLRAAGVPVGVSLVCPGWVRTRILDADRNWPDEYGERPPRAVTTEAVEPHVRRAIAEGLTPAALADQVATSVTEDRFWVLPDVEWMNIASDRWDRIRERIDPQMPEETPGLPPASQLLEEMTAAMMGDAAAS
jgi:NAD(P)-dependent dehydrogenase (short-subunit alcohol dehydrogenase family)